MEKYQSGKLVIAQQGLSEEEEPPSKKHTSQIEPLAHAYHQARPRSSQQPVVGFRSLAFLQKHFPHTTTEEWNNYKWQLKNSIRTIQELSNYLTLSDQEIRPEIPIHNTLPLQITPYYLSLLDAEDPQQALRKSMVPVIDEFIISEGEASDPLFEGPHSPVPNIVHRYPDRVLFLVTGFCSAYCRYCTRSHMVAKEKCHIGVSAWEAGLEYIQNHPEVRDVLISGGDPLTMSDNHLGFLLQRLRAIEHVEIIRIGTKVPAVLPQRITPSLVNILSQFHPLYLSIHFTHPDELTPEVKFACEQLANAGIPLGSQTVLLKGVNDTIETMKALMHGLLKNRVRPYYLYQCDPILGSSHFRTSIEKGLEIIQGLRGHTTGYAVPQYVVDAPGGGGKIPLLPEYYQGREGNYVLLKNYEGNTYRYPDFS